MDGPQEAAIVDDLRIGADTGERFEQLHTLIGRYISVTNGIEQDLHGGIAAYFKQPLQLDGKFCSWVLARIETSETIQLVVCR
jgi:hypothetical protein